MNERIMLGAFGQLQARAILDPGLSDRSLRVLALMCAHAYRGRMVDPKLRETDIAAELGITQQAIAKHIRLLVERGYVDKERRGFPARNLYRIVWDQPDIPERIERSQDATPSTDAVTTSEVVTGDAAQLQPNAVVTFTTSEVVSDTTSEVVTVPIGTEIKTQEDAEWPDPQSGFNWTAINRWARSPLGRYWMQRCRFDPDGYSQSNRLVAYQIWWEAGCPHVAR